MGFGIANRHFALREPLPRFRVDAARPIPKAPPARPGREDNKF
jgi:hypothetical protein